MGGACLSGKKDCLGGGLYLSHRQTENEGEFPLCSSYDEGSYTSEGLS